MTASGEWHGWVNARQKIRAGQKVPLAGPEVCREVQTMFPFDVSDYIYTLRPIACYERCWPLSCPIRYKNVYSYRH